MKVLKEDLTVDEKREWLQNASKEELLSQFLSFVSTNKFGRNDEDIALVKEEIFSRMSH